MAYSVNLTEIEYFLYYNSVFTVGFIIFFVLLLASAVGHFARRYSATWYRNNHETRDQGDVISASLTLLALLLGFTFAMAVDRYDKRRGMGTEEAAAISDTYLMSQTFENPHRDRISNILVDYVDSRLIAAKSRDRDHAHALLQESEAIQRRLWAAALAATETVRDDISSSFLQSARETISIGSERVLTQQGHIPRPVYVVLLICMTITAMVLGFASVGPSRYLMGGVLLALLTLSMVLIIDLDRPTSSANAESQRAMEVLKRRLEAGRAEALGRLIDGTKGRQDLSEPAAAAPITEENFCLIPRLWKLTSLGFRKLPLDGFRPLRTQSRHSDA